MGERQSVKITKMRDFKSEILEALNMKILSRRELAEALNVEPRTEAYGEFTECLDRLSKVVPERHGLKMVPENKLDLARDVRKDSSERGGLVFFRRDQEDCLVNEGRLSSKTKNYETRVLKAIFHGREIEH